MVSAWLILNRQCVQGYWVITNLNGKILKFLCNKNSNMQCIQDLGIIKYQNGQCVKWFWCVKISMGRVLKVEFQNGQYVKGGGILCV